MRVVNHIRSLLPVYIFALMYAATTLMGNFVYITTFGRLWPRYSIAGFSWSNFDVSFGAAYWTLLLLPVLIVPLVAVVVGRRSAPVMARAIPNIPEFPALLYSLICAGLYVYVFAMLFSEHALNRLVSAPDAISAVEARFALINDIGFWPITVMQSVLVFLSIYAIVRAARHASIFWSTAAAANVVLLSVALILLNMKWPVVIFLILVGFCVLTIAQRHPILKSVVVLGVSIGVYFVISMVLLRLIPASPAPENSRNETNKLESVTRIPNHSREPVVGSRDPVVEGASKAASPVSKPNQSMRAKAIDFDTQFALNVAIQTSRFVPKLLIGAINRMAMAAPYYYDRFTREGPVCGTILDRIERIPSHCQPSNYIYAQMFGDDGFQPGSGTAPAAVNISGYALGGFPGALIETVLAAVLIGLFVGLYPLSHSRPMIMTCFLMGSYAAYFMTQLPIEASVVYPHGILWWAAPLGFWWLIFSASRRLLHEP